VLKKHFVLIFCEVYLKSFLQYHFLIFKKLLFLSFAVQNFLYNFFSVCFLQKYISFLIFVFKKHFCRECLFEKFYLKNFMMFPKKFHDFVQKLFVMILFKHFSSELVSQLLLFSVFFF
jgi:hypothetical protein